MKIKVERGSITDIACDLLVVNLFEEVKFPTGAAAAVNKVLDGLIINLMKEEEFSGKRESVVLLHTHGKLPAKKVVVVGLGRKVNFDMDAVRTAAATAIKVAKKVKAARVCSITHGAGAGSLALIDAARATVEGTLIGAYEYEGIGREADGLPYKIKEFVIVETDKNKLQALKAGVNYGEIFSRAAINAKNLVNAPANVITPNYLAGYARENARKAGIRCDVFDVDEIKKMGLEALWSVARGSEEREKLIVLRWMGAGRSEKEIIGLVGKGVTFDAGGISLKSPKNLWEMKTDMAGAAAVIEIMVAASKLKIKKNLLAIIPATENMPDGASLKPGDVINSFSGKTIEIISTDAEGRLILADAVAYAKKLGATKIIDIATLTGGCVIALGDAATGVMGNDQKFVDEVVTASKKSGEKVWQLPLFEVYGDYLKSDAAYVKNCTETGMASPIIGGIFIEKFVGDIPWVHFDIAGTAFLKKQRAYLPRGATGVPVRTVLEYLSDA